MWIMTIDGWRQLGPMEYTRAPEPIPNNGMPAPYAGKFPSKDECEFVNSQKEQMKYFDDGLRMSYGRADRRVETDNADCAHPIKYPPKGWVLMERLDGTKTWVQEA